MRSNSALCASNASARCCNAGKARETRTLFYSPSGHGHFDLAAQGKYLAGELNGFYYREAGIKASLAGWLLLPRLPQDRLRLVILFLAVKVTAG